MAYHPFRRLGLKTFSLTLSVLLWVIVAGDRVVERTLRASLEYQNVPEGIEMLGVPPSTVDVRVRGRSGALGRLNAGEVVVVLDLATARSGTRLFPLHAGDVRTPFGMEITDVVPSTISLDFERTASRFVPVRPDTRGTPAEGYVASKVTVTPSVVEVFGPESRIKGVVAATTDALSLEGANTAVSDQVTIGLTDRSVRLRTPQRADVRIDIVAAQVERVIRGVTVGVRNAPPSKSITVTPATVDIAVSGLGSVVNGLDARDLRVWVDCNYLDVGRHEVTLSSDSEQGYGIARLTPRDVEVRIR
jgi:YbbR domain-containing protein